MKKLDRKQGESRESQAESECDVGHAARDNHGPHQRRGKHDNIAKSYRVTVTYIQLSDEEVKVKRSILEHIIKSSYMK